MNRVFASTLLLAAVGCNQQPPATVPDPPPPGPTAKTPDPKPPAAKADTAAKAEAVKRLRQVGRALHDHHDSIGTFPAGLVGPKGEVGLSWRVQILPYLKDDAAVALLKQFKLDEPWDSPANKPLIEKMPAVFATADTEAAAGKTHLRSFVGETAFIRVPPRGGPKGKAPPPPFGHLRPGEFIPGVRFADVTDGTSNTLMVAEAAEAVEWTKPDELPYPGFGFDPKPAPLPKLGGRFPNGFHGLMCDGAVHFFSDRLKESTLRAMITTNGGEVLDADTTAMLFPPKPTPPAAVPDALADAAERKTSVANLQKLVKAVYVYADAVGHLPAGIVGPDAGGAKTIGLSWRVQMLPILGEQALYEEFHEGEPWDSDHNKKLVEKMPAVFASPGTAKGHTVVRTTIGPNGLIRTSVGVKGQQVIPIPQDARSGTPVPGMKLSDILDGLSYAILLVESGPAVPWTKPDDYQLPRLIDPYGKGGPPTAVKLPPLGGVFGDGFHAAMADGRVTFYTSDYPPGELAKLLCPNDGWVVDLFGVFEKVRYSVHSAMPAPPLKPAGPTRTKSK